jgi:caa(3)-type oxidase subunit IV
MSGERHDAGSAGGHEIDIDRHVRVYIIVFVSLMALTLITVAVSYLHLPVAAGVTLALLIATVKGALVACYFMHLISEKKLIFVVMAFTVLFFLFVLLLPTITDLDRIAL